MKNNHKRHISYDHAEDVLAFYLQKGREEKCIEFAPGVIVELAKDGGVIGIEILNASQILKPFIKSLEKKRAPAYAR